MQDNADHWEHKGFLVKDRRNSDELFKIVGYEVSQQPAALRLPCRRSVALHHELSTLITAASVSRTSSQHTLGVWMWELFFTGHCFACRMQFTGSSNATTDLGYASGPLAAGSCLPCGA